MGASVIHGNFQRMKLDFTFVMFASLKLDICLKLKKGSDIFINGSN